MRLLRNRITIILLLGLFMRLIYVFFFSKYHAYSYYGIGSVYAKGPDITMWLECLDNLINHGSFSSDISDPDGPFARMPGYAFFISLFYFLPGEETYLYFLSFFQVFCDVLNIYFVFRISENIYGKGKIAYISAIIYAVHPINIIWAPFLSAESLAVFLMLYSLFILVCSESKNKLFYFGLIAGFNILVRPQMAIFVMVYLLFFLYKWLVSKKETFKNVFIFGMALTLSYGWWPARNLLLYDELVFTHRMSAIPCWGKDVQAYMSYNYSVQSNWQPQFNQILSNKTVEVDRVNAYKYPSDSALLNETFFLCQNYCSGFSEWPNYWKKQLSPNKYDTIAIKNFEILRQNQIEYNGFHYWIVIPLENLKKCFFKNELLSSTNNYIKFSVSVVFLFRSIIILLGIVGSIIFFAKYRKTFFLLNLSFLLLWYLMISGGNPDFMRNVEMRYLIQCDTLMIFPVAYVLYKLLGFIPFIKERYL